jgi:putative membrane protein
MERTLLAGERTLLAYLRTALVLLLAGGTFLKLVPDAGAAWVALAFAALAAGVAAAVVGTVRFLRLRRRLREPPPPEHREHAR